MNEQRERVSGQWFRQRRKLLIGLGGLGAIVLVGGIWQLSSRIPFISSPPPSIPPTPVPLGTTLCIYRGHSMGVESAAWSPDSRRVVTVSDDKTAQIWNAIDGSTVFTYTGHLDTVANVAWS